jgi:DNA-directed RNA polymerase alpha subunit
MEMTAERQGIEPATGERAEILKELSKVAFELIKIVELERAGIRDGNGHWENDADVIGDVAKTMNRLFEHLQTGIPTPSPILVEDLWLSVRSANCLRSLGLKYVSEVEAMTDAELLRLPNFGRVSLKEVREASKNILAMSGVDYRTL